MTCTKNTNIVELTIKTHSRAVLLYSSFIVFFCIYHYCSLISSRFPYIETLDLIIYYYILLQLLLMKQNLLTTTEIRCSSR